MSTSGNPSPNDTQEAKLRSLTSIEQFNTCSLILSAAGISHRTQFVSPQLIEIFVTITDLQNAADQLEHYEEENRNWPQQQSYDNYAPVFRAMAPIVIAALIYMYSLSGEWSTGSIWFSAGAGDSTAILLSHEYYRLVTALTLHANAAHLLGNCFLGGILLHFLLLSTGNGIGLFAVLTTATLANFINVILHGPGHLFVGFSTAVFAVIGMLCTIRFSEKTRPSHASLLMPLMAGFALLAFLGSSGEHTDLGGHLFGLVCGFFSGNIIKLKNFDKWRQSFPLQITLVFVSVIIISFCWLAALSN